MGVSTSCYDINKLELYVNLVYEKTVSWKATFWHFDDLCSRLSTINNSSQISRQTNLFSSEYKKTGEVV